MIVRSFSVPKFTVLPHQPMFASKEKEKQKPTKLGSLYSKVRYTLSLFLLMFRSSGNDRRKLNKIRLIFMTLLIGKFLWLRKCRLESKVEIHAIQ